MRTIWRSTKNEIRQGLIRTAIETGDDIEDIIIEDIQYTALQDINNYRINILEELWEELNE